MVDNVKKWYQRDPLPAAVFTSKCEADGLLWVAVEDQNGIVEYLHMGNPNAGFGSCTPRQLEQEFGPCTPLVPETESALTIPSGDLRRALELRMGEHAKRIIDSYSYHPEDAVKAGEIARLALAINSNINDRWMLVPISADRKRT